MPEKLDETMPDRIAFFLIAGVYTSPDFMEALGGELVRRARQAGIAGIHSRLLFPYGDWGRSLLGQLREVRRDLNLSMRKRARSVGGQFVLRETAEYRDGWRIVLIGHSAGGLAAVHALELLKSRKPLADCRVVQIGSPKCRIPDGLRSSVGYLYAAGPQGGIRDPVCRLGTWGGWERGRFRGPVWNRRLYRPGRVVPLQLIGGHADYFRDHRPYLNGAGVTNLDVTVDAFWPLILP
ncbi:hypothetical protein [Paenibacillus humicola]|uniref:hypothetical protein n=1 Tax=Paenibacillus humicola TaxID=3110540 RepID=UPI00237BC4E5|nr:hypothetical protein [Paenibacillus humicola]